MYCTTALSVRERPETQLLFADLPQPREPVRFHRQEEDDQGAERHELQVRGEALAHASGEQGVRGDVQEDRKEHDERGAEEGAEHASHPADYDHEENLEGAGQIEGLRLDGPQVGESPERAGDAAIEGT